MIQLCQSHRWREVHAHPVEVRSPDLPGRIVDQQVHGEEAANAMDIPRRTSNWTYSSPRDSLSLTPTFKRSGLLYHVFRLIRPFEGVHLTTLYFRLESRTAFHYINGIMNKRPPAKKPQAKIQTVKKQIPVKKIAPDRTEELVKKHLGKIGEAENAFKNASALLEKHKTKYPELEQYIEHVTASDRSIQILEDIKDPRRAHYIFKIPLTGVEPAYQVAHPGEKDHTNVDRAAWISTLEEALAEAIVQIVLSRQAEQASQAVGSPTE
jgi:hypothetical protein